MKGHSPGRALKSSKSPLAWTYKEGRTSSKSPTASEGQVFLEPGTHPVRQLSRCPFPFSPTSGHSAAGHSGGQSWPPTPYTQGERTTRGTPYWAWAHLLKVLGCQGVGAALSARKGVTWDEIGCGYCFYSGLTPGCRITATCSRSDTCPKWGALPPDRTPSH